MVFGETVSVAFKPGLNHGKKDSISQQRVGEKEMHLNFHFSDTHPSPTYSGNSLKTIGLNAAIILYS